MFPTTLNSVRRLKTLTGYIGNNNPFRLGQLFAHTLNPCNHSNCTSSAVTSWRIRRCDNVVCIENSISLVVLLHRKLSTKVLPKPANVFGDLSADSYLRVDMDKDEEEHEKFEETDGRLARWQRLSPGQYGRLIKSHVNKRDLQSALGVLDIIKENRDQPTVYMYNLLIRAFSIQGDIKRCFKLFNDMKKRNLVPNAPTYNSLINACGMSSDTNLAVERLEYLRQLFVERAIPLNDTHYNTMIKSYSLHNRLEAAFELADEMWDKRLPITPRTYACLLHAAVSDKKAGLRHAIIIWHLMRNRGIKPTIHHYNLLLRTIKETKLGEIKVGDVLIPGKPNTEVRISDSEPPDLLAEPPLLSTLLLPLIGRSKDRLEESVADVATTVSFRLDDILTTNRLILFGGYRKILDQMKAENISPDVKTMTMLMELMPSSMQAEQELLKYASNHHISLDVDFFNMLIKKRNMRHRYQDAKAVLNEMQLRRIMPNIMTFGVLALGCEYHNQGRELVEQMENNGFIPNETIIGTLIYKSCVAKDFPYLLDMMNYMVTGNIAPSQKLLSVLEKHESVLLNVTQNKSKYDRKAFRRLKREVMKFDEEYKQLKEKLTNMRKK